MSTPSKKRRAAREWMQRVSDRHELEKDSLRKQTAIAVKAERDRLTQMFPPRDEPGYGPPTVEPLGRPEHPRIVIAALGEGGDRRFDPRSLRYFDRVREYHFKVKQYAQVMPCGLKVVWYGLEHCA